MKRARTFFSSCMLVGFCLLFVLQGCLREDLTGTLPVLSQELIGDYLSNHPEHFSEFTGMLNKSGVMGFLKAYGAYTVFAPTNEAIERYYTYLSEDKGESITSYNQLSLSEVREFCFNHIIKGDSLSTKYLQSGLISSRTMSGRFYSVTYTDSGIIINDYSRIVARDIMVHNGIIHAMDEAFRPAYGTIAEVFEKDSTRFSFYVKALKATGVYDEMNKTRIEDERYDYTRGIQPDMIHAKTKPEKRKFGFTILAVSDADLANYVDVTAGLPNGIHSLADLEKLARYHYGIAFNHDADTITDKTDKRHYLNRFISYHCFNRAMYHTRFISDYFSFNHFPEYPMTEYIETMLENTIVEVLLDKQGTVIGPALFANPNSAFGVFNFDDPIQRAVLTDTRDLPPGGSLNGYYHGITSPIMYTKTFSTALSSKRLRMDVASFFPELTTNNIRGSLPAVTNYRMPEYNYMIDDCYLDNYQSNNNKGFFYGTWGALVPPYQGDWMSLEGVNIYTLTTCPIPAGTYEVRISNFDAYCTLLFDGKSCGELFGETGYVNIGYVSPGSDKNDPLGYENDKNMRNLGFMKGPITFCDQLLPFTPDHSARYSSRSIRRIVGTYTFEKTEKHQFKFIVIDENSQSWTYLDYVEFCPVSFLQKEGID